MNTSKGERRALPMLVVMLAALSSTVQACGKNDRDHHRVPPESAENRSMSSNTSNHEHSDSPHDKATLSDELLAVGYDNFFHRMDEEALDRIWRAPNAMNRLAELALDVNAEPLARFLAAEILAHKHSLPEDVEKQTKLAELYATALAENFTGTANPWGLPGTLDGATGEHVVSLGEAAVPHLIGLLDNDARAFYEGSQEATYGNSYAYRVKDLAAFYISRIRDVAFAIDRDPDVRDREIAKLKQSLQ